MKQAVLPQGGDSIMADYKEIINQYKDLSGG